MSSPAGGPLAGRVALLTGLSRRRGIGFALARRLLADGAAVFATGWTPHDAEMPSSVDVAPGGVHQEPGQPPKAATRWGPDAGGAESVLAELGGTGGRLAWEPADLEDPAAPARLVDATLERFGRIDAVVANHGRSSHQSLAGLDAAELDRCWAVNARSCVLLAKRLAERRAPGPGGRLVLFTSGQHQGPMPDEIPYAVSKGAVHQMTATLADALADRGITVNCVNPGPTDTGYATGAAHETLARLFPAGRWGTPEDVANLVAWLVSDEAAWITGQVLVSEGGFRRWGRRDPDRRHADG